VSCNGEVQESGYEFDEVTSLHKPVSCDGEVQESGDEYDEVTS
jgi:hypothetical protein